MNTANLASEILAVYHDRGDRSYGEDVTERAHALQCAEFATQFGEPPHVILACLLHDYGHLLHDLGEQIADGGIDARHEDLGADYLTRYFPPQIVEPIRLHVVSKRYLCGKYPAYLEGLSPASRKSLMLQGGPMTISELAEFERHPHFEDAIRVRRYDDMGKVPNMPTATIDFYQGLVEQYLLQPAG